MHSSMVKIMTNKEKGGTKEPLLPTPPTHHRLNMGVENEGKNCELIGKSSYYNSPKVELVMFCGERLSDKVQ